MSGPQRWALGWRVPPDHSVPLPIMVRLNKSPFSAGHRFTLLGPFKMDGQTWLARQLLGRGLCLTTAAMATQKFC